MSVELSANASGIHLSLPFEEGVSVRVVTLDENEAEALRLGLERKILTHKAAKAAARDRLEEAEKIDKARGYFAHLMGHNGLSYSYQRTMMHFKVDEDWMLEHILTVTVKGED